MFEQCGEALAGDCIIHHYSEDLRFWLQRIDRLPGGCIPIFADDAVEHADEVVAAFADATDRGAPFDGLDHLNTG